MRRRCRGSDVTNSSLNEISIAIFRFRNVSIIFISLKSCRICQLLGAKGKTQRFLGDLLVTFDRSFQYVCIETSLEVTLTVCV